MKFVQLKAKLNQGSWAPVYAIEGDDAFLCQKAEGLLLAPFRNDLAEMNCTFFSEGYSAADIVEAANVLPFLQEKRAVTVRDFALKKEVEKGPLADYLAHPHPETLLIFAVRPGEKIKWPAGVEKVDCSREEPSVVSRWIAGMFRAEGLQADAAACTRLCDYCLCNMGRINGEIKKLSAYCSGRVTEKDVEALVAKEFDYVVFDLSNAVLKKDAGRALSVSEELTSSNDPGFVVVLLTALYNSFKRMYAAKVSKESDKILAGYFKVKEYAVTMARKQAARVPAETLKRCMDFCAEADFAFKSGKMPALSAYRNALLNILNA